MKQYAKKDAVGNEWHSFRPVRRRCLGSLFRSDVRHTSRSRRTRRVRGDLGRPPASVRSSPRSPRRERFLGAGRRRLRSAGHTGTRRRIRDGDRGAHNPNIEGRRCVPYAPLRYDRPPRRPDLHWGHYPRTILKRESGHLRSRSAKSCGQHSRVQPRALQNRYTPDTPVHTIYSVERGLGPMIRVAPRSQRRRADTLR